MYSLLLICFSFSKNFLKSTDTNFRVAVFFLCVETSRKLLLRVGNTSKLELPARRVQIETQRRNLISGVLEKSTKEQVILQI